jgi:hypothetical protein
MSLRLKLWNYLGTEVHLARSGFSPYLFCVDCASWVSWAALIPKRKWWTHTACPSCEDYMHFMCGTEAESKKQ